MPTPGNLFPSAGDQSVVITDLHTQEHLLYISVLIGQHSPSVENRVKDEIR